MKNVTIEIEMLVPEGYGLEVLKTALQIKAEDFDGVVVQEVKDKETPNEYDNRDE